VNVAILYEDSRGPDRSFTFHDLVVRAVADRKGLPEEAVWALSKRVKAMPRKGNGNVLAEIRDPERLGRLLTRSPGYFVVAVFDRDKSAELAKSGTLTCVAGVTGALLHGVRASASVKVVLLDRNLETVVAAVRSADPNRIDGEELRMATLRKNRSSRDLIFSKAASSRRIRDALRVSVPSFAYLVDQIAARLA